MLKIRDLSVTIGSHCVVSIEELEILPGQRMGLVGESGSGKTMTGMTIAGLQPTAAVIGGSISFEDRELTEMSDRERAHTRGSDIGVIFQDPLKALNPMMRVGKQVAEAVRLRTNLSRSEARQRAIDLLSQVHLSDAARLARRYPHQLSGGQRQRALIAMAIARRPKLLIADEPTTALDVTVQQGILELILELSQLHGMALLFISHDLGVVRAVTDRISVMYGGRLVESGPADAVIEAPKHRYTEALIGASPTHLAADDLKAQLGQPFSAIPGSVPQLGGFPAGCRFRGRCPHEIEACQDEPKVTHGIDDHRFTCWNPANEGDAR